MRYFILICITVMAVVSCGYGDPLKPGYIAIGYEDEIETKKLKDALDKRGFHNYTYIEDGRLVIAFPSNEEKAFELIRFEVTGSPPTDFRSVCTDSEARLNKHVSILIKNDIEHIAAHISSTDKYCVSWPKRVDGLVAEVDPGIRAINEARKRYGTDINQ